MEKLFTAACACSGRIRRWVGLLALPAVMMMAMAADCSAKGHVLIYTKNSEGFVHDNIAAGVDCLKKICQANGWTYETTAVGDSSIFDDAEKIASFDVLVFANTNNDAFENDAQRKVFQAYIRGGGAFVGIHSACGSERNWSWFWANLGGKFLYHPQLQKFEIKVLDSNHPSTTHLPDLWQWEDEFYFVNELNPGITVLLAGDLRTLTVDRGRLSQYPGRTFGDYFPLAWHQTFEGGRQWYTALGHKIEHYADENFIKHLEGGLRWAMNKAAAKPEMEK